MKKPAQVGKKNSGQGAQKQVKAPFCASPESTEPKGAGQGGKLLSGAALGLVDSLNLLNPLRSELITFNHSTRALIRNICEHGVPKGYHLDTLDFGLLNIGSRLEETLRAATEILADGRKDLGDYTQAIASQDPSGDAATALRLSRE